MTPDRGAALVTLDTLGRPFRLASASWSLWRGDVHEEAVRLEDLPEVDGNRLGRVRVAPPTLASSVPDRFFPPLSHPPGVVELVGDRCVVVYAPGFRGLAGEGGVVLEPLTLAGWTLAGGGAFESLEELHRAIGR